MLRAAKTARTTTTIANKIENNVLIIDYLSNFSKGIDKIEMDININELAKNDEEI